MKTIAVCDNDRAELLISKEAIERYAEESGTDIDVLLFDDVTVCLEVAGSFDIVFMDIDFEGAPLGIEAVRRINEIAPNCQVVYLTNYLQYSLDVYVTDHVWYVLKSQFEERLPEIIRKISLIDETRHASIVIETKGDGRLVRVSCNKICYLERRKRETYIVMQDGTYVVRDKLADLLDKLPKMTFARCHNSYAVNLERISEIFASDMLLDDGTKVLISRSYSKRFRERYLLWAEAWTV